MRHRFWATQIAFALVAPFLLIAIEPLLIFFAPETLGGAGSDSTFLAKKLKFVVKLGNSI